MTESWFHGAVIDRLQHHISNPFGYNRAISSIDSTNIRFAEWSHMHSSGKKIAINGVEPFPYEGAADRRVRLVDMTIQEIVQKMFLSVKLGRKNIVASSLFKSPTAKNLEMILEWAVERKIPEFDSEMLRWLNYAYTDTPGVSVMKIGWNREVRKAPEMLKAETLATVDSRAFEILMMGDIDVSVNALQNMYANESYRRVGQEFKLSASDARRHIEEVRSTGQTILDIPFLFANEPTVVARRQGYDVLWPDEARHLSHASEIFEHEWVTRGELLARKHKIGYKYTDDFISEKLETEGETSLWAHLWPQAALRHYGKGIFSKQTDDRESFFSISKIYFHEVGDDGVVIPRELHFCSVKNIWATAEAQTLRYSHGRWPFVSFETEVIGETLKDARGVPYISGPDQELIKSLADSGYDNTMQTLNPPLMRAARLMGEETIIGLSTPLWVTDMNDYQYLERGNTLAFKEQQEQIELMQRDHARYWGLTHELVPQTVSEVADMVRVQRFLEATGRVCWFIIRHCQQFLTLDQIQQICGNVEISGREEIQGDFDMVDIVIDPRNFNVERAMQVVKASTDIASTLGTNSLNAEMVAETALYTVEPKNARKFVLPPDQASARDVRASRENIKSIVAGVPPDVEEKQPRAAAYLQEWQAWKQANQELFGNFTQTQLELAQNYEKALVFQLQQQENAKTGRMGAQQQYPAESARR